MGKSASASVNVKKIWKKNKDIKYYYIEIVKSNENHLIYMHCQPFCLTFWFNLYRIESVRGFFAFEFNATVSEYNLLKISLAN